MSTDTNTQKTSQIKKIGKLLGYTVLGLGAFSLISMGVKKYIPTKPPEVPPHIIVAYTADPDVTGDGQIKLGYPEHRFSVTCSDTVTNQCVLEVENGKKKQLPKFSHMLNKNGSLQTVIIVLGILLM